MIGSFWNFCRACPSMPVDKLHSEYRSTYRWHEYTGRPQEVVRQAPAAGENPPPPLELPRQEPILPRRRKHPELAYRTHEIMARSEASARARSEERTLKPSRRSKSEGPTARDTMQEHTDRRTDSNPNLNTTEPGKDGSLFRDAITRISTEYRLQFAWPPGKAARVDQTDGQDASPRKSVSMNALKPAGVPSVKKRADAADTKDATELEPLVHEAEPSTATKEFRTEYKKKFRPFSQYEYSEREGRFARRTEEGRPQQQQQPQHQQQQQQPVKAGKDVDKDKEAWIKEVVELRKKAGEYKNRGWGTELSNEHVSELYRKQLDLWDQVSRRSSLSALALADASFRASTKEQKEKENKKKITPECALEKHLSNSYKLRDLITRHHLERTTGGSELDGLILSPTREKLEPTLPRKEDDSKSSQRASPHKGSPRKDSPQKKRTPRATKSRSQSVGPVYSAHVEKQQSPRRHARSSSVKAPAVASRKPRPSSLNTNARSRPNSSVPQKSLAENKPNNNFMSQKHAKDSANAIKASNEKNEELPPDDEPVVKSPPEPTRVKSPEQIIARSPDPVNWTVPLDTGKTFTVTQNVIQGDKTQGGNKTWSPQAPDSNKPSASPDLTGVTKPPEQQEEDEEFKSKGGVAGPRSTESPDHKRSPEELEEKQLNRTLASDVLERARNRFDKFWGKMDTENQTM